MGRSVDVAGGTQWCGASLVKMGYDRLKCMMGNREVSPGVSHGVSWLVRIKHIESCNIIVHGNHCSSCFVNVNYF